MLKVYKKIVLRLLLCAEILICGGYYFFSPHGLRALTRLEHQNAQLKQDITTLEQSIKQLETQIKDWNTDPFYKEKLAREELQLAYPGDEIYLLNSG